MAQNVAAELSLNHLVGLLDSPCEMANLDFKETLDVAQCRDRVEFAKDVLAMANSGGGDIVVGVEDTTRRRVGISQEVSAALRDAKSVNDKLKKYCGGFIRVLVAQHEIPDPAKGRVRLALIRVPRAPRPVPAQDDGVFPDPSNPKKQKWIFRRGDIYVRKGDESVKVETPEDLLLGQQTSELGIGAALVVIEAYTQQLEKFVSRNLPPVPPSEAPGEMPGQPLIEALLADRDILLIGPSGCGKTVHLKHACLAAVRHNELPLIAVGGRYKGEDLFRYLAHAVAPFSQEDTETLFKAASISGSRVVLMFDGLNECKPYLEDLAREIHAFRLRYPSTKLLFASQTDLLDTLSLDCERIFIAPMTATQKRFIYCYHAKIAPTTEVDHLCQGFSNGYDMAIAGRCHDSSNVLFTRVELYDRYTRDSLPREGASVLLALLRAISDRMGLELANFWFRDDFERRAEEFLSAQRAGLGHLDQLKSSRLISLTEDSFSFEHELLLDYFRAEQVRRDLVSPDQLAPELTKPKNQSLIPFLLPRYKEASSLRVLLRAVLQPEALREVLLGRCGEAARQTLVADCKELFSAAASDVTAVTLNFNDEKPEPAKLTLFSLSLTSPRQWTPYEVFLCDVIAISLDDHELQSGFIELLDLTQWTLRKKAEEIAHRSGIPFKNIWAVAVGQLGMLTSHQLPFLRITASLRHGLMRAYPQGTFALRDQLLARINRDPTDHFSLAILLDGLTHCQPDAPDIGPDLYISVTRLAWESRIYHLRLNALHLLQLIRHYLSREHKNRVEDIRNLLGQLKTGNLFLSSSLVEVQVAYGVLQPDVSVAEIAEEMKSVIAESSERIEPSIAFDPCRRAYSLLSNIFEDIYQGAYDEAYESLACDDKVALLCLAAQAERGLTTGRILTVLLSFGKESALPIFQKYASGIDADSTSPQESAAAYALGVAGCAQFMDEAPKYTGPDTAEHGAWHIVGEILFWLLRNKKDHRRDTDRIERLWVRLTSDAPLAAADALYRIYNGLVLMDSEKRRDFDLVAQCPSVAKPLLEQGLKNRTSLTSIFRWGGSKDEALVKFVIEALGRIGDDSTIPLLREVSDDPRLGAHAIAAIRKIRESTHDLRITS
jgi:hypothetical protein